MSNENHNWHSDFLTIPSLAVSDRVDSARTEPLAYHRRGHWLKSSIAHLTGLELAFNPTLSQIVIVTESK